MRPTERFMVKSGRVSIEVHQVQSNTSPNYSTGEAVRWNLSCGVVYVCFFTLGGMRFFVCLLLDSVFDLGKFKVFDQIEFLLLYQ